VVTLLYIPPSLSLLSKIMFLQASRPLIFLLEMMIPWIKLNHLMLGFQSFHPCMDHEEDIIPPVCKSVDHYLQNFSLRPFPLKE
jgi:hypothetical protein